MKNDRTDLRKYTTHNLVVAHWMEKIAGGYELLRRANVRHLPVVDDNGAIVGIISDRDFYRAMQVDQPDFVSGKVTQPEFDPNARVRDYMSWPVEAIDETKSIVDAARIMLDKRISSLIVTRHDQVVGIVTTEDLLRALVTNEHSALKDLRAEIGSMLYNSTIGQIANTLANAGI